MTALELAILFHEIYERLAPQLNYETRCDSHQFDAATPNGRLMVATCKEVLRHLTSIPPAQLCKHPCWGCPDVVNDPTACEGCHYRWTWQINQVERFQAGDRVRIWDQHSTLHGQVGTVVQADEQRYQYATVLVDGAELPQWWPCAKLRRVGCDE